MSDDGQYSNDSQHSNGYRARLASLDTDLAVVAVAVVVSAVVLLAGLRGPVAWLIGSPLLMLWPGYAVVAALLPEAPVGDDKHALERGRQRAPDREQDSEQAGEHAHTEQPPATPGWPARLGLSLLLSAIVVAVTGIAVNWLAGIRLAPAVIALASVTLGFVAVASARRQELPPAARATPLDREWLQDREESSLIESLTSSLWSTRQARALSVAVLLLLGTVAVVAAVPPQPDGYTESYILTENESGELVAEGYPTTFPAGEGRPLAVGLENNEHRPVNYTVITVAERVGPNGSVQIREEVDRFGVDLAHNESTVVERQFAPTTTGENVRLQFWIYKGELNGSAQPDQTMQLWIDAGSGDGSSGDVGGGGDGSSGDTGGS